MITWVRSIFVLSFCILLSLEKIEGQQGNNWYFGYNSGITFSPGQPVGLNVSSIFTNEGSASISDENGNLLFYTDGTTVFNRNHSIMTGGTLNGHFSSSQSAMIVQRPGSPDIYYIFTSPSIESGLSTGYFVATIDMSQDAGLGAIVQNSFLYAPATEKLTAARQRDGIRNWVITLENVSNKFKVFGIDCNGLNLNPVVSMSGDIISGPAGYMKASPDGNYIAVATTEFNIANKYIRLYKFDNSTGIVSQQIKVPIFNLSYGVEFSPDSKKIYVSSYPAGDSIYQFDLNIYDSATISASKYVIATNHAVGGLQNGPDGKLYLSNTMRYSLGAISFPNLSGQSCQYVDSVVALNGQARGGLTNIMPNLVARPNADFSFNVRSDCSTVDFNGTTLITGPVSWLWNFGDGTFSSQQNPSHTFPGSPNQFQVKLTVTPIGGCGEAKKMQLINLSRPQLTAYFSETITCGNLHVQFSDTSTLSFGSINSWFWDFGDGGTSNSQNPGHTYLAFGNYTVKLKVTYSSGCVVTDSLTKTISIGPKPIASFTHIDKCVNDNVFFQDQSNTGMGAITGWNWSFGDGNVSNIQNPMHVYTTAGSFLVKLVVNSSTGCISDTFMRSVTIHPAPISNFTVTNFCAGAPTLFTDNSVSPSATISQWQWDFGDATTASNQHPNHIFANPGTYNVSLKVVSSDGCPSTLFLNSLSIDSKPLAVFSTSNGCINQPLNILNNSQIGLGTINSYNWSWAPSNSSASPNPVISFSNAGAFDIKLSVGSANGCVSDTAIHTVIIESPPNADFAFQKSCPGLDIGLVNSTIPVNGQVTTWQWAFGDGQISTSILPQHIYSRPGNFNITLTSSTQFGCTSTKIRTINVKKARISVSADTNVVSGQPLQLFASGGVQYNWQPSQYLNSNSIANPVSTPLESISYLVTGTTAEGCVGEDVIYIKVYNHSTVYVPTGFTPNGDGLNDVLKPISPGIGKLEYFNVYNRWGQLVFSTSRVGEGWDGMLIGIPQNSGTFIWTIKGYDFKGNLFYKKGLSQLIR